MPRVLLELGDEAGEAIAVVLEERAPLKEEPSEVPAAQMGQILGASVLVDVEVEVAGEACGRVSCGHANFRGGPNSLPMRLLDLKKEPLHSRGLLDGKIREETDGQVCKRLINVCRRGCLDLHLRWRAGLSQAPSRWALGAKNRQESADIGDKSGRMKANHVT